MVLMSSSCLVINYDMPNTAKFSNYIHHLNSFNPVTHSGRNGVAIKFVYNHETHFLHEIEHISSTKIEALPSNGELVTLIQTDNSPLTIFQSPIFISNQPYHHN